MALADGTYPKLFRTLARTPLLILDDWLRDPLSPTQAQNLLEVLDDRYGCAATLVATQIPVAEWHARIPESNQAKDPPQRPINSRHQS